MIRWWEVQKAHGLFTGIMPVKDLFNGKTGGWILFFCRDCLRTVDLWSSISPGTELRLIVERNLTSCFNYLTGIFDSETQEQAGYPYASAFAFYSAVILCLNLLPHVLFQSLPYGGVCACFMVLITGVYGLFFLQAMKKSGSAFTERRNFWTIVFSLFITGSALYYMQVLAYCFLLSVGNYNGVAGYFLGTEALDALFHSSIIESIVNFGVPSTLYMELDFLKYHTGIHFLLAGIAKITNLPALYLLHYIFYDI